MRAFVGGWNFGGAGGKTRYPRHAAPRQAVSIEMPPVLLVAGPGRGDGILSAGKPLPERGGKERQHWRDYVRLGDLIPVELAAVLNGGLRPLSI